MTTLTLAAEQVGWPEACVCLGLCVTVGFAIWCLCKHKDL